MPSQTSHVWLKALFTTVVFSPLALLVALLVGIWYSLSQRSVVGTAMAVMAAVFIALTISAWSLQRSGAIPSSVWQFQRMALLAVLVGWLWQRIAFNMFIPGSFLRYGFFLEKAGRSARLHLVELPVWVTLILLIVLLGFAVARTYRSVVVLGVVGWWVVLGLLFYLPAFNWTLQGDAAIFI